MNQLVAGKGWVAVPLFAYDDAGIEKQYLVSFGLPNMIDQQATKFAEFDAQNAQAGHTIHDKQKNNRHFSAISYRLIGGNLETIMPFAQLYHRKPAKHLKNVIQFLYGETLSRDPKYRQIESGSDLLTFCRHRVTRKQFNGTLQAFCDEINLIVHEILPTIIYTPSQLVLELPDEDPISFPNPELALTDDQLTLPERLIFGIIHGNITGNNLLAGENEMAWLIDYKQSGIGPLVCDFVSLEVAIKLDLMAVTDLPERFRLEELLLTADDLGHQFEKNDLSDELAKAVKLIEIVRQIAHENINASITEYHLAILFQLLQYLQTYEPDFYYTDLDLVKYGHALLSAAKLYDLLSPDAMPMVDELPAEARHGVWLNPSKDAKQAREVWIEGQKHNLPQAEYLILSALYQHPNRERSREQICNEAFGMYDGMSDDERLNTYVSRLRRKRLNKAPSRHDYIRTIPRFGYRFEPRP